jgi:uncharacterized protein with FMN-binding domain
VHNFTSKLKRIALSAGVIITFAVYSFALRHQDSGPVIVPPSLKNRSSSTAQTGSSGTHATMSHYKDGSYVGNVTDAFYGNVQVQATITSGKITDIQFLQFPNDNPNSQSINQQAIPLLRQEAINAQGAHVDIITGATDTSTAFVQSLSVALTKAQA